MKSLFLFLVVLGSVVKTNAQALQFYTGAKIEDDHNSVVQLFSQDSLYIYAFVHKDPDFFLDVYEKETLKRHALIKIPLPSKDTINYSFENLLIRKDTFNVFYSYFDKTDLCEKLEMITFDTSGARIGDAKLIDRSEGKNQRKAGGFSVMKRKRFNEFLSYGSKRLKDTTYINIGHFNYSGIQTSSQNFSVDYKGRSQIYYTIDNDCNLYNVTRSKWGLRKENWNIQIYSPESNQAIVIELKEPSTEPIFLSRFFNSYIDFHHRINFVSSYSNVTTPDKAEGIYLVQVDPQSHQLIKESVIPFKVFTQNNPNAPTFSLSSCILKAIIPMSNKAQKIVFESRLETVYNAGALFDINQIITVDMDSNNVITEIHEIQKQQHTNFANYQYTGFAILNHADKSYFIYNELPGNLERRPDKMKKVNSSKIDETTIIYTLVDSGNVKRNILINKSPGAGIDAILPGSCLTSFNGNEIYVLRKIEKDIFLTKIFYR